jgi:cell division protein ZapE
MQQPEFVVDKAQLQAVARLDELYTRLVDKPPRGWWQSLFSRRRRQPSIDGLYLWGGVGRGKTLLMDLFYQSLPAEVASERVHFHSFMNQIHHDLKRQKNTADPLQRVAAGIAQRTRVLCLDEFVIIDIADAMIMAGLFKALFAHGVLLVTTSNAAPQDLYRDGLQRARFLGTVCSAPAFCLQSISFVDTARYSISMANRIIACVSCNKPTFTRSRTAP